MPTGLSHQICSLSYYVHIATCFVSSFPDSCSHYSLFPRLMFSSYPLPQAHVLILSSSPGSCSHILFPRLCYVRTHPQEGALPHPVQYGEPLPLVILPGYLCPISMVTCVPFPWLPVLQFGWTHLTLFMLGSQAYLLIQNVLGELYWFILPVSLVICNDIMAYLFGKQAVW